MDAVSRLQAARDRARQREQAAETAEDEAKRAAWNAMRRGCPEFAETVPDWQRLAQRFGGRISGVTAGPDGAESRWGDTDMHDVEVNDVQGA